MVVRPGARPVLARDDPAGVPGTIAHGGVDPTFDCCAARDRLLTIVDVAGRFGVHEQIVRSWIKSGELKVAEFGTRIGYRITRTDYEDFLRRRTLTGAVATQLLKGASAAQDS